MIYPKTQKKILVHASKIEFINICISSVFFLFSKNIGTCVLFN